MQMLCCPRGQAVASPHRGADATLSSARSTYLYFSLVRHAITYRCACALAHTKSPRSHDTVDLASPFKRTSAPFRTSTPAPQPLPTPRHHAPPSTRQHETGVNNDDNDARGPIINSIAHPVQQLQQRGGARLVRHLDVVVRQVNLHTRHAKVIFQLQHDGLLAPADVQIPRTMQELQVLKLRCPGVRAGQQQCD